MISMFFMFLCLVSIPFCVCREEGDACLIKMSKTTANSKKTDINLPGTCKKIFNCEYGMRVLFEDEKKPPMCWWEDDVRVVCCPTGDMWHKTGAFGRLYDPSSDGIKRSADMNCFYDGTQHLCCPREPDMPLPAETGCPALDTPNPPSHLSIAERIAWKKCMENQRFVHKCVAKADDRYRLERKTRCFIPEDRYRVSGGEGAVEGEFPHMAVLGLAETKKGSTYDVLWVGAGSLISDRYILTAAHVLIDTQSRPLRYAKLGCINKTDVRSGILYNIVNRKRYHLYNHHDKNHDIALLRLDRRVKLSEFVRPICLPVAGFSTPSNGRTIAGWGRTGENSDTSEVLLTTDIEIRDGRECEKELKSNSTVKICARGNEERNNYVVSDSCPGDSGGPLMAFLDNVDCSYSAEGVVSHGPECGKGAPAAYTRVSYYLEWIVKNVWREEWEQANRAAPDY